MPNIGPRCHELRVKDAGFVSFIRLFYAPVPLRGADGQDVAFRYRARENFIATSSER